MPIALRPDLPPLSAAPGPSLAPWRRLGSALSFGPVSEAADLPYCGEIAAIWVAEALRNPKLERNALKSRASETARGRALYRRAFPGSKGRFLPKTRPIERPNAALSEIRRRGPGPSGAKACVRPARLTAIKLRIQSSGYPPKSAGLASQPGRAGVQDEREQF